MRETDQTCQTVRPQYQTSKRRPRDVQPQAPNTRQPNTNTKAPVNLLNAKHQAEPKDTKHRSPSTSPQTSPLKSAGAPPPANTACRRFVLLHTAVRVVRVPERFFTSGTLREGEVCQLGQHGHVRDAEGRSAGLLLTLNIPPCLPKKRKKRKERGHV